MLSLPLSLVDNSWVANTAAQSSFMTDLGSLILTPTMPVTGLVELYRQGLPPAAAVLLHRFRPYLRKWDRLLCYGRWDHKDKEIRHFLQMMGSVDIEKTAQIVSLSLRAYESEDIEQEIRVIFLEVALKTGSIRKHFRYYLQRRVVSLLRDPLVYHFDQHVAVNEITIPHPDVTDIDDLWVAGLTCGPGFDELTPNERKVLQLHHYYGYTIDHTAKQLGIGTATVSRVIAKAKRVLAQYYVGVGKH